MSKKHTTVPWYRSLRFKLVVAAITVELVMLSVLLFNSFRLLQDAVESQTQTRLEAITPLLDAALAGRVFQNDHAEVEDILQRLTSTELTEIDYVRVYDHAGNLIATSGRSFGEDFPVQDHSVADALTDLRYDVRLPLTIVDMEVGAVSFGLSLVSMVTTQDRVVREGIIIALFEILLSLLLLITGGYFITRHIRSLSEGTQQLAGGNYDTQIHISGHDEIAMLARNFNDMTVAIATNIDDLRASRMRAMAIFNAVSEAIVIHDANTGEILDVNTRMCEMFACSHKEALGSDIGVFSSGVTPYTQVEAISRIKTAMTGIPQTFEWQSRTFDGRLFWSEVSLSMATIGHEDHLIAVVRDTSERKETEQLLAQAQKMESVGRLAGGVAHDFNNYLTTILGYAELALMSIKQDDPMREKFTLISEAGQRAAAVTRQLLAFSRKQVIETKPVDLNLLISDILKILRKMLGEDINVTENFNAGNIIMADQGQIEQIIMNLVVNARDAMPYGGDIIIETKDLVLDSGYSKMHPEVKPGEYIMLALTDTGEGMTQEIMDKIFEPFFTTKERDKGTGLGLATVHGIVKQHSGHIFVYSELNRGTTFKIYFPVTRETVVESRENKRSPLIHGNHNVLVVDDEPAIRQLVVDTLTPLGYTCFGAACGKEALEIAATSRNPIDLLLTDVIMPGMSGRELADIFCEKYPTVKTLYMSGYTENAIAHHGVLDQGIAYIAKPLTPASLAGKVHDVLSFV